ncbi:MAG: sulfurtransferase-like selenium metabolism protein YedF [Oscillospiraceae bacterium]|nr:sulfurtransferase-like selenium metabolism protein YedF [Oscillospiraceae bacterium]
MMIVDARGKACPLPVVMANKALQERQGNEEVQIYVDNDIAVQNVKRMAASKGLDVAVTTQEDYFILTLAGETNPQQEEAPALGCSATKNTVVAITSATMGTGSDDLGKLLMKGFLYAISQQEQLPKAILFYNGGASIPIEGSISLEDLKAMEAQGVEIYTCGTCLDFFGLKDKLAVGSVTNMYSIVELLSKADHIIRP